MNQQILSFAFFLLLFRATSICSYFVEAVNPYVMQAMNVAITYPRIIQLWLQSLQ